MGPHPDAVLVKLVIEGVQASLEPGALDRDLEVLEPDLQQVVVGQLCPGELFTRHDATNPNKSPRRCCHGRPLATTAGRWTPFRGVRNTARADRMTLPGRAGGNAG